MALKFPAFLNATVRQPLWLGANALAFSTWVKLACRCAEDENGGRLGGATTWGEHIWLTIANVTTDGVACAVASGLASWDGDSLVVAGYDQGAEGKVQTLRDNGQFGHLGGRPVKNKPKGKPIGLRDHNPLPLPFPSDPIPTGSDPTGQESQDARGGADGWRPHAGPESAPPAAAGAATTPPGRWSGGRWLERFRAAFWDAKGRQYGRGETDARAARDLTDRLAEVGDEQRAALEAAAPRVFAAYFRMNGSVATASHPFRWFAERSNEWADWLAGAAPARQSALGYHRPVEGKDYADGMEEVFGKAGRTT